MSRTFEIGRPHSILDLLVVKHIDGFFIPRMIRGSPFSISRCVQEDVLLLGPLSVVPPNREFRSRPLRYLDDDFQMQELDDVPTASENISQTCILDRAAHELPRSG
jgi:hypothetical protein